MSWRTRCLLAIGGVLLAIATAEAALRIIRFHFDLVPAVQFGWPDPTTLTQAYETDPDLVWITRGYRETLRDARRTHPAVVFMGDSCTEFGSYPARTITKLQTANPTLMSGLKLGVGGWSTEQGITQLRRDVLPLHPKIITIYYGWNDHWIAMGLSDPEITAAHRMLSIARFSRIVQLWVKIKVGMAARRSPLPNRVPLERYEDNLRTIAREARAAGVTPLFITAASNHVEGHEPQYLARRHLRRLAELVPLHKAYVEATRRVAKEVDAPLCDAAAAFAALPAPHDRFFQKDGIHLTDAGNEELANLVSHCILQAVHAPTREM